MLVRYRNGCFKSFGVNYFVTGSAGGISLPCRIEVYQDCSNMGHWILSDYKLGGAV